MEMTYPKRIKKNSIYGKQIREVLGSSHVLYTKITISPRLSFYREDVRIEICGMWWTPSFRDNYAWYFKVPFGRTWRKWK